MTALTYLTLAELEALAFDYPGFEIVGAQGPSGGEWHLRVPIKDVETTFRAHRAVCCESHAPAESVMTK